MGAYDIVEGLPRNPQGRTGLCDRGTLGRWGPNHAADPIVTRWRRNEAGKIKKHKDSNKPILQFIAIKRRDSGEWALPGGMVDPGEAVSVTLKREFSEEAMNTLQANDAERDQIEQRIHNLFHKGTEVKYEHVRFTSLIICTRILFGNFAGLPYWSLASTSPLHMSWS